MSVQVRIDPDTLEKLRVLAKSQHRSMTAQLAALIDEAVKQLEAASER